MVSLGRLSHSYLLNDYDDVQKNFELVMDKGFFDEDHLRHQVLIYNDPGMILKYMELHGLGNLINFMFNNNYSEMLYEHPESFLTKKNIDSFIEYANTTPKIELLAFLLDYKNKHFPAEEDTSPELTV